MLDEYVTNLRELIDCAVALLTPFAIHRNSHVSMSVDQTVAETIFVDGFRVGQLIFHLIKRTVQLDPIGDITLVVRAEPVNQGMQQVFMSVVKATGRMSPCGPAIAGPHIGEQTAGADAYLPLCRLLAQRMQGELFIANGSEMGVHASFDALFAVEQRKPSASPVRGDERKLLFSSVARSWGISASVALEPFERRYLDSLYEEGIDLPMFLNRWRRAMHDDLERLRTSRRQGDFDHLRGVLHRLSGAVGLVGARSLMEAFRRASTSPSECNAGSIDTLIERARSLIAQLEPASPACWSDLR